MLLSSFVVYERKKVIWSIFQSLIELMPQLFTFLGLSTANAIASSSIRAEGLTAQEVQDRQAYSEKIMCFSVTLAACIGMGTTIMLFAAGPVLLRALGSSPEIIPFALPYLRIRALASPAVMFTIAAQGACLGQEDMWTPLKVILVSGLINLVGDMHLILNLKMGTVGAALATTAAQYAGAAFFLWYLIKGGSKGAGLKLRWKGLPTLSALKPMLDVGQILLARTGATMIGYTAITSAATVLGTVAIAAHQVTLQVFWLLSCEFTCNSRPKPVFICTFTLPTQTWCCCFFFQIFQSHFL